MIILKVKDMNFVACLLGALGLILMLAGPAFHFIPTNSGIFFALLCWIGAGWLSGLFKMEKKK